MKLVKTVCERCGREQTSLAGALWPVPCRFCSGDAAPRWWFRENNPDQSPKGPRS